MHDPKGKPVKEFSSLKVELLWIWLEYQSVCCQMLFHFYALWPRYARVELVLVGKTGPVRQFNRLCPGILGL